jgi:prephenate dehydratase
MTGDAAYQGARGAFSEDAARALLGPHVSLLPCRTLADVFAALAAGRVDAAVVPISNSIVGPVPEAAELIARSHVRTMATHDQPIEQAIVGVPGASVPRLAQVCSHPVALAQCRRWLSRHPHVTASAMFDTAGAVAAIITCGDPTVAAVASRRSAEVYGGVVLEDCIQDHSNNHTRFLLLTRGAQPQ